LYRLIAAHRSLHVVSSSHTVTRIQIDPGNVLTVTLEDIELGPSEKGYVLFTIAPVVGLPDGTAISNFANIYFDSMPPVRTNDVTSTVLAALNTPLEAAMTGWRQQTTNAGGKASVTATLVYEFAFTGSNDPAVEVAWNFGANTVPATAFGTSVSGVTFSGPGPHTVTATATRCGSTAIASVVVSGESVVGNSGSDRAVTLCHNDGVTLNVAVSAVAAHIAHGDYIGQCSLQGSGNAVAQGKKQQVQTKQGDRTRRDQGIPNSGGIARHTSAAVAATAAMAVVVAVAAVVLVVVKHPAVQPPLTSQPEDIESELQ